MKKYKTWEMVKAITENPRLKFKGYLYIDNIKTNRPVYVTVNGDNGIVDQLENEFRIDEEWELVQQSVPFMEAVKAYAEGKTIECEIEDRKHVYKPNAHTQLARDYGYELKGAVIGLGVSTTEILKGTWYICNE